MAYINEGDMLMVEGRTAIATKADYTKLVYDAHDWEMMGKWKEYEGGTATGYVDVLFTDTGTRGSYPLKLVTRVSQR